MGVTRHPLGSINGRNPAYRSHRRLSGASFTRVESVRLNLWNFGGQDIYHGSHALFLHGQAIFLVVWTPALERQTTYQEGELSLHHRPLSYWLDYLRNFSTNSSVLIVQSQYETARDRASHPPVKVGDFCFLRWLETSARTGLGLNLLKGALEEAVRDCVERRPPSPIGVGRVAVRDRMRPMLAEDQERESAQRQHRLRERAEFDRICDEIGGVSDKNAMEQHFKDLGSPTSGSTRRCRNGTTGSAICSPM
jgi:internalin A